MRRRTFLAASLGGVAATPARARLFTGSALAFGTSVGVAVCHEDEQLARRAIAAALAEARKVDRLMSIYDPASQVYQLNRDGVLALPDPHLLAVLAQARALSELTRGAFDITVQPLWLACRAGLPSRAERLKAQARVNWQRVAAAPAEVRLVREGMQITLNGLAQGYAADLAGEALRAHGICHALVDMGEFAARGHKPGYAPWTLGVRDPRDAARMAASMRIDGRCVATSGDYAAAFTDDYVHHHIFDPASGMSPPELASVTVLAPTAMLADGLSTSFMVLGAKKSHALAARLPAVDLMTINKRGVVWKSPGFPGPI